MKAWKQWKRWLSMGLSLTMVLGTLESGGFRVMAAEPEGPLVLKEGESWGTEEVEEPAEEVTEEPAEEVTEEPAEEVTEEPAEEVTEEPAEEVTEEPAEEATEEPAEEATEEPAEEVTEEPAEEATGEEAAEEPAGEAGEEAAEEAAEGEELPADTTISENELEWHWEDELDETWSYITAIKASVSYQGQEYPAEVVQGELVKEIGCVWPAQYKFTFTAQIGDETVTDTEICGFGLLPNGHDMGVVWKLNTDDVANPYYYPVCSENEDGSVTCSVCGEKVFWDMREVRRHTNEEPSCDHDIIASYEMEYILVEEDGSPSDIVPFVVQSGDLTIPATGVHTFMKNTDTPWWS